jgi:hypothetical protein
VTRLYEKLPENFDKLSDEEIKALAQNMWAKISEGQLLINREAKLELRRKAYSIWINKYPNEKDDDVDCHLEEIYSLLIQDYLNDIKWRRREI